MLWRIYAGYADRFGPPCVAQMDFVDGVDAWNYAFMRACQTYDADPAVPMDVYEYVYGDHEAAYDHYQAERERHIDYFAEMVE